MSESDNTRVVRDAYQKFTSGDIDGLLGTFTEDIDWNVPEINGAPQTGHRKGLDNVREFFGLLDEYEEFSNFEPREFITEDDRVVVLGSSTGKIKPTGRNFETDWVHIFTVRDGRIAGFLEFFDTAAMERAYQRSATA